jgi:hypothetical protein
VADSLGTLTDALITTAMKLWHVQDEVYAYDRMSAEEYAALPAGQTQRTFKRLSSLNLDRARLMRELDECLDQAVRTGQARVDARVKLT